jgi:uncharacterized protein
MKRGSYEMSITGLQQKKEKLVHNLKQLDSLLIAFSGGVDSTFLLAVAHEVLKDRVTAVTASSATYPLKEQKESIEFVKKYGIKHIIIHSDEVSVPEFSSNTPDRCYHCKKILSSELKKIADKLKIQHIALAVNMDDLTDYRPGIRAATEMGLINPLVDAELSKEDIRILSREMDLPTWNKPAMACLASRIPYGDRVTKDKLRMIEEAEDFLIENGFSQCRVRHHGSVARIEVSISDIAKMAESDLRTRIVEQLKKIGFLHIALDLEGYTTGSLNKILISGRNKHTN